MGVCKRRVDNGTVCLSTVASDAYIRCVLTQCKCWSAGRSSEEVFGDGLKAVRNGRLNVKKHLATVKRALETVAK